MARSCKITLLHKFEICSSTFLVVQSFLTRKNINDNELRRLSFSHAGVSNLWNFMGRSHFYGKQASAKDEKRRCTEEMRA